MKITPTHLRAALDAGGARVLPQRVLVVGGEALGWDLVDRVRDQGECRVINHYGPTETTIGSLTFEVDGARRELYGATVPIGRPISNTALSVVQADGRQVPPLVPGELLIGGAGLADGYVNRPDETEARFTTLSDGTRAYRTGDRVRVWPDGSVEFIGRVDQQVKIRGFRVEPGEVEAALRAHPGVRQAAVTADDHGAGERRLVAYLVADPAALPSREELRAALRTRLPDYMVPSAFVALEQLPLGPSGKLDLSALPAPETERPALDHEYVAPRTANEQAIAELWHELLDVDRVGVDDDFFALGGHSLLATRIIAWIRSSLGVQLPLQALFEAPTVSGLAAAVETRRAEGETDDEVADLLDELETLSDEEAERLLGSVGDQSP
jgi:acyl carrier protein